MTDTEYLDWRSRGIGASDIAGILEISPWDSPYSVWASKVINASGDGTGSNMEAMKWGKLLEDVIITEAARRLDCLAYGQQTRCEHSEIPWARATVDAFCRESDAGEGVIEAKTTGDPYWHELPAHYEAQVLWQLEVSGRAFGWVAALHAGRRMSLWRVERQPELQRAMLDAARIFWDKYVIPRVPPIIDGFPGTTDTLNAMYSSSDKNLSIELDALGDELDALKRVRKDIATLERDRDRLENTVKAAMERAEIGTLGGKEVVTWKSRTTRRVDLDTLREKYPAEAAACETVTESRTFLVKGVAKSRSAA
jgi:putative phage-type endonuclease